MNNRITEAIRESVEVKEKILNNPVFLARIDHAVQAIYDALTNGKKVLFCGNGGSAADAQHLAAELSGRFYFDRPPLDADALHCNTSYLTAVANDYGYDEVYARMIKGTGKQGDILVGLSTSGNSVNILKAFEVARQQGMVTIAFTGESGGKMKEITDILFNVPSTDTPRIQESHGMIGHIICEIVEERIFGSK